MHEFMHSLCRRQKTVWTQPEGLEGGDGPHSAGFNNCRLQYPQGVAGTQHLQVLRPQEELGPPGPINVCISAQHTVCVHISSLRYAEA